MPRAIDAAVGGDGDCAQLSVLNVRVVSSDLSSVELGAITASAAAAADGKPENTANANNDQLRTSPLDEACDVPTGAREAPSSFCGIVVGTQ